MFASLQIVMLPSFLVAFDPIPAPLAVPLAPVHTNTNTNMKTNFATPSQGLDLDRNCPFRSSKIYRSIYVYPSPGTEEWLRNDSGVVTGKRSQLGKYPWDAIDEKDRKLSIGLYELDSQLMQYTTELLVREIITNPNSCLRTHNPDKASLFYVPYLPATELHNGSTTVGGYQTSPYGQALMDVLDFKYEGWETLFGLTSKYWKRRNGSDHILVYSEPMHGLWHPKNRRGNFHFVSSQRQLAPPIAVSVELSTTFVGMYPHCARKNILMPYPNTDGRWFNSQVDLAVQNNNAIAPDVLPAMLEAERNLSQPVDQQRLLEWRKRPKPLAQYYRAGAHGTCTTLRRALNTDLACTESGKWISRQKMNYSFGYRQATFCPCPGGDSPSAKRMFDVLHGGCIPVVLSHDFVWPFSNEFDVISISSQDPGLTTTVRNPAKLLDPNDFSIRLNAADYSTPRHDKKCNVAADASDHGLQSLFETISPAEIQRLREGGARASDMYAYYARRKSLPDNPLQEGILPDGGAAQALVGALAERVNGALWLACEKELQELTAGGRIDDPKKFIC